MKKNLLTLLLCAVALLGGAAAAMGCKHSAMTDTTTTAAGADATPSKEEGALVTLHTTEGDVTVRLFDDTPVHRDNFLKLVKEHTYDGTLFHRVIPEFMVQAGDPESRHARPGKMLGSGDLGYTLPAEFVYPGHFHRRGALAAARQGDQANPERRSSASQFYIVTGRVYNDTALAQIDARMLQAQKQEIFNALAAERRDTIMALRRNRDQAALTALQEELRQLTEQRAAASPRTLTAEQRRAYSTVGGTPHLDGQYTVFGEVVSGMDVIDRIQQAETDANDRPRNDIRITTAEVVKP